MPVLIDPAEVGAEPVNEPLCVRAYQYPQQPLSFSASGRRQPFVTYSLIHWHGLMQTV